MIVSSGIAARSAMVPIIILSAIIAAIAPTPELIVMPFMLPMTTRIAIITPERPIILVTILSESISPTDCIALASILIAKAKASIEPIDLIAPAHVVAAPPTVMSLAMPVKVTMMISSAATALPKPSVSETLAIVFNA